jgi:hypothetical protein
MIDGWPIAHHVFAGNWRDANTVPQVLRDLEQRFGRVIVEESRSRDLIAAAPVELSKLQ